MRKSFENPIRYNGIMKGAKTMPYILQTNHLTKTIGHKELVKDINLHVEKGEIYGFIGPNGAGKTTVMKMLLNIWKPTAGTIELFGETLTPQSYGILKRMGSILEFPTFYEHMTGYENLKLHCAYMGYYSHGSIENALEMLELTADADKPVRNYSLGMKERLGIARALLCRPELLILDEPTNGLDPGGIKHIRDLLRSLSEEYGTTILISSHILSEIESIAHRIGLIHGGRMLQEIAMKEIRQGHLPFVEVSVLNPRAAAFVLTEKLGLSNFKLMEDGNIRIYDNGISPQELSLALAQNQVEITALAQKGETLEDYFLKMTEEGNHYAEVN